MTDFLTACACHGRKPKGAIVKHHHSRADLLAKLIRHRQSPRFLIAPALFGKTSLAAEYAEHVFSFEHVYWVNGQSPCFLRDLDKMIVDTALLSKGSDRSLVVFDDMPYLGEERERIASDVLETFISRGWEVIVTMAPGHDMFMPIRKRSLCLHASDLLLTDAEIDACRTDGEIRRRSAATFLREERIPGLFWSDRIDHELLVRSIVDEGFSDQVLLQLYVMLVLKQGDAADVALFVDGCGERLCKRLYGYLYLGIGAQGKSFDSYVFPVDVLAKVFSSRLDGLVSASLLPDRDSLVSRLADVLLDRDDAERACEVIRTMVRLPERAIWLAGRSGHLFSKGCIMPAHRIHESLHAHKGSHGGFLLAVEAWRLALLDERERAIRAAIRLYRSVDTGIEARILSCLLVARYGNEEKSAQALVALAKAASGPSAVLGGPDSFLAEGPLKGGGAFIKVVTEGRLRIHEGYGSALGFVRSCISDPAAGSAVSVVLAWMAVRFRVDGDGSVSHDGSEADACGSYPDLSEFIDFAVGHIRQRSASDDFNFFDAILTATLDRLSERLGLDRGIELLLQAPLDSSCYETALLSQRKAYWEERRSQDAKKAVYRHTHPDEMRPDDGRGGMKAESQPRLKVHLIGGLEVFIGDKMVAPKLFSRQKVKALLALLVLHLGKELSRERLCHLLWPESDELSAQHNLYSVWSLLKKALMTPDGVCPYLIRTQFSYKMDSETVASDVSDLAELCRVLQFGQIQGSEWPSVFAQLNDRYAGDLLPSETKNETIVQARRELKTHLVDALATAALRQYEAKDLQTSQLLARAALSRDASREDVYTLLMQTQVALGQRTAALDTFFRCRQYLSEQLGIDPSCKTRSLYLQIIDDEPALPLPEDSLEERL